MAYNKARAEKEWLKWKNEEEAKLRELGVDEDTIGRLHVYDWAVFNSDRRFYEPQIDWESWIYNIPADSVPVPVRDIHSLLDETDDPELFRILAGTNPKTLEVIFLRACGYTTQEISRKVGLSPKAINLRIERLRKKLKKFGKE